MLKKSQIFTIAACSAAAVLLTGVLVAGMAGDGFSFGKEEAGPGNCQNREDLSLDGEKLAAVEVSWVAGPVTIGKSPDGDIHIIESARREITQEDAMQVTLGGGKLTVRWDGQWFRRWINWNLFGSGHKALEVQLPAPAEGELVDMKISNTSGDIKAEGFSGNEMHFSSTSGDILLKAVSAQEKFQASTVSGDMTFEEASCGELEASTTSGSMTFEGITAETLGLNTTSGDCKFTGGAQAVHANTVSGEIWVELSRRPDEVEMDSVSGDVWLGIPENDGFIADYSSVSGDFETEFGEPGGGKSGKLRYGAGGAEFGFHTTSGSMSIFRTH